VFLLPLENKRGGNKGKEAVRKCLFQLTRPIRQGSRKREKLDKKSPRATLARELSVHSYVGKEETISKRGIREKMKAGNPSPRVHRKWEEKTLGETEGPFRDKGKGSGEGGGVRRRTKRTRARTGTIVGEEGPRDKAAGKREKPYSTPVFVD